MSYRWRRRRNLRRQVNKYNLENFVTTFNTGTAATYNTTVVSVLIPPNLSAGVRKVANLRGNFSTNASAANLLIAIICLPEGFDPTAQQLIAPAAFGKGSQTTPFSQLTANTGNSYTPSQNVLWFGQFQPKVGTLSWRVPINKNLNGGDQILMLVRPLSGTETEKKDGISMMVSGQYAICYR